MSSIHSLNTSTVINIAANAKANHTGLLNLDVNIFLTSDVSPRGMFCILGRLLLNLVVTVLVVFST